MSRKVYYWTILLNPAFLALYVYGLSVVYELCKYGGVSRRLPLIAGIFVCGVLWFVVRTIIYFVRKKKSEKPLKKRRWVVCLMFFELAAMVLFTGYYGYKIYQSAKQYNGKLGSYISDLETKREITIEASDRDFLEYGLNGIFDTLADSCGLDEEWELYTANTLVLKIDENGIIQSLEAFLYAFDENGTYHSWLIDYNAASGKKMTVYIDNYANTDYMEQEQLTPLLDMIEAMTDEGSYQILANLGFEIEGYVPEENYSGYVVSDSEDDGLFTLRYSGYSDEIYQGEALDLWYTVETEQSEQTAFLESYMGSVENGANDGFLLTLYRGDTKVLTIIIDAGTLETQAEIETAKSEEAEIDDAKSEGKTLVSDDRGMTFYLDENVSMSLIVTDAAAGSRAYAFENGEIYNEDPFSGRSGVAESIYFIDEETGFILLSNASQDSSGMYYTADGGATFEKVNLPVSDGEEDLTGNEFDYQAEDMDYIYTPYEEDGVLYVEVSYDYSGRSYLCMLFESPDNGKSWQYVSCENNL